MLWCTVSVCAIRVTMGGMAVAGSDYSRAIQTKGAGAVCVPLLELSPI